MIANPMTQLIQLAKGESSASSAGDDGDEGPEPEPPTTASERLRHETTTVVEVEDHARSSAPPSLNIFGFPRGASSRFEATLFAFSVRQAGRQRARETLRHNQEERAVPVANRH